jgi:hypothetical protein
LAVNRTWSRFAEENGAPELAGEQLLGEPIWRYVDGGDVTRIYRELFGRVRQQRVEVVVPFRCDSPDVRREMLMKVLPQENNSLEIHCITKSVVRLSVPDDEEEAFFSGASTELLRICAWCKSLYWEDRWIAIEAAINRLNLLCRRNPPPLTHTICTDCSEQVAAAGS